MITEDQLEQLEQLAIQWFQDTGWNYVNGKVISPEGEAPEREGGWDPLATIVSPFQGCGEFSTWIPRALPWAIALRPVGAWIGKTSLSAISSCCVRVWIRNYSPSTIASYLVWPSVNSLACGSGLRSAADWIVTIAHPSNVQPSAPTGRPEIAQGIALGNRLPTFYQP